MAVLMVSKSRKNKYGVFYSSKKRTKIIILSSQKSVFKVNVGKH